MRGPLQSARQEIVKDQVKTVIVNAERKVWMLQNLERHWMPRKEKESVRVLLRFLTYKIRPLRGGWDNQLREERTSEVKDGGFHLEHVSLGIV